MTTKLTLEDLEAMRQHYGIAQREAQGEQIPGARGTYGLLENLKEVAPGGRYQLAAVGAAKGCLAAIVRPLTISLPAQDDRPCPDEPNAARRLRGDAEGIEFNMALIHFILYFPH